MVEKRKYKRFELRVTIQLESLADVAGADQTMQEVEVQVLDVSRSGIGFRTKQVLEKGEYYNTQLEIWTKESIPCVIEIIRKQEEDGGEYQYGGIFVGLSQLDKRKFYIYELVSELEKNNNQ